MICAVGNLLIWKQRVRRVSQTVVLKQAEAVAVEPGSAAAKYLTDRSPQRASPPAKNWLRENTNKKHLVDGLMEGFAQQYQMTSGCQGDRS